MQFSQRPLDRLLRGLALFGHRYGIYGWWQRLRNKWDKTRYQALPVFATLEDATFVVHDPKRKIWRKDTARVFFDLLSPPQRWWTLSLIHI